jgi:hypothetical protein
MGMGVRREDRGPWVLVRKRKFTTKYAFHLKQMGKISPFEKSRKVFSASKIHQKQKVF